MMKTITPHHHPIYPPFPLLLLQLVPAEEGLARGLALLDFRGGQHLGVGLALRGEVRHDVVDLCTRPGVDRLVPPLEVELVEETEAEPVLLYFPDEVVDLDCDILCAD